MSSTPANPNDPKSPKVPHSTREPWDETVVVRFPPRKDRAPKPDAPVKEEEAASGAAPVPAPASVRLPQPSVPVRSPHDEDTKVVFMPRRKKE